MPLERAGVGLNISLEYAEAPFPRMADSSLGHMFAMAFQGPSSLGCAMQPLKLLLHQPQNREVTLSPGHWGAFEMWDL